MKHRSKNTTTILTLTMFLSIVSIVNAQEELRPPFNVNLLTKQIDVNIHSKLSVNRRDYDPFIRIFLPAKNMATGRAVVICPGGGYAMVATGHEGYSWATYFNTKGIAVIVLKYRQPKGNYKIPIFDTEAALKMVKDSAKVWNIIPEDVGIMGFSAGGHLASTIATHTLAPLKPNFQILFYPVITMDKKYTHIGSHDNLLGKNPPQKMEELFSNEKQVTKDTPPAFIALAADDEVVPPANSVNYFEALFQIKVYATLHVYPTGGHGWGFKESYKFHDAVLNELSLWLDNII